ncbi:hypothetical protein BDV96DRAFT_658660 [Lophiotrema nucula]|uniref:Uncharacterized protein n=1 Tax=Lophiotrema nucula TaxID=690887 RepID=A0A6A5ZDD1_9PLEO|nr:hypothetical protein BDV96DRAFT_658660 [Lophiotrema nucula]
MITSSSIVSWPSCNPSSKPMAHHHPTQRHEGTSHERRDKSYPRHALIDSYRPGRYSSTPVSSGRAAYEDLTSRHQRRLLDDLRPYSNSHSRTLNANTSRDAFRRDHTLRNRPAQSLGQHGVLNPPVPSVMVNSDCPFRYASLPSLEVIQQELQNLGSIPGDDMSRLVPYTRYVKYNVDTEFVSNTLVLDPDFKQAEIVGRHVMKNRILKSAQLVEL